MNLAQLTTRLNAFEGFDLTDSDARDLLNEARRRFARRSKYPRKTGNAGPTVAGQAAYDFPADYLLMVSVSLDGSDPLPAADPASVKQFTSGSLILEVDGVWYEAPDEAGVRQLYLYPTPDAAKSIDLEWVYRPTPMINNEDEPSELPEEFHPALLPEVAAVYYETVEDDPELAQRNSEKADLWVADLTRYDNERRAGDGIFRVGIAGVTA
jgi:hypothetical protein